MFPVRRGSEGHRTPYHMRLDGMTYPYLDTAESFPDRRDLQN